MRCSIELDELSTIYGDAIVATASTNSSICDFFNKAKSDGVVRGRSTCTSRSTADTGNGTNSPNVDDSAKDGKPGLSNLDIAGIVIGVLVILAVPAFCFYRKWNNRRISSQFQIQEPASEQDTWRELKSENGEQVELHTDTEKVELYASKARAAELAGTTSAKEMDASTPQFRTTTRTVPGVHEAGSEGTVNHSSNHDVPEHHEVIGPLSPAKNTFNMTWDANSIRSTRS